MQIVRAFLVLALFGIASVAVSDEPSQQETESAVTDADKLAVAEEVAAAAEAAAELREPRIAIYEVRQPAPGELCPPSHREKGHC